jgi:aminopeptidase N
LYAVLAGPYEELKCERPTHRGIPMSLYSRKVLMGHLKK